MKKGEWNRCAGCQQAYYCSKECQTSRWKKHKPNCYPPGSSIQRLFKACFDDLLPVPPTVAREYGFDNMRLYHGDVLWGASSTPLSAEQILLSLFQMIRGDVCLEEQVVGRPRSSIRPSMKMIVEAYENNSLDDFIHRFIRNVLGRYGSAGPQFCQYCLAWVWNRLVIGPTRTEGLTQEQVQRMRKQIYHKYYGTTSPENCCCASLEQEPTIPEYHMFSY